MRIGLIIDRFVPAHGGVEKYLCELADYLLRQGDEVFLFSMDQPKEQFPGKMIPVPGRNWPRGLREIIFAKKCQALVRQFHCEVTIATRHALQADYYQPHGGAISAAWHARAKAAKHFLWPWNWKKFCFHFLEKRLVASAKKILPLSQMSANEFQQEYPSSSEKLHVLPLGVDVQHYSAIGPKADLRKHFVMRANSKIALFVGNDFVLKGLLSCLQVTAQINGQGGDLFLLVIGRGKHLARWQEKVGQMNLQDKVKFLGQIADPAPYYRAADILLHPTFYDPCSRVVLEALACGLPVVTSKQNGAAETKSQIMESVFQADAIEELTEAVQRRLRNNKSDSYSNSIYSLEEHCAELRRILFTS